jgi:hypothetical protein
MRIFTLFSRFCLIFSLFVISAFTIDNRESNGISDEACAEEALAAKMELTEIDRIKKNLLSILPASMARRATPIESGDYLTIQQLIEKGEGNFPATSWNLFRFDVYSIALETKERYPRLGSDVLQLYDWMMKTFRIESGFRSDIKTPLGSASGIFQITGSNRRRLSFPSNWRELSPRQQLPWYKVYLFASLDGIKNHSLINDKCDFYMINFMPAYADSKDSKIVASACGGKCKKYGKSKHFCAYHANHTFDLNKDGKIQKYEVGNYLERKFKLKSSKPSKKGVRKLSSCEIEQSIKVLLNNSHSEYFHMLAFNFQTSLINFRVLI